MNKSGMGVGSASIILVFAVLCLTIFALISLTAANVDKTMLDISSKVINEYYEADTLAECILAEILDSAIVPDSVYGIDISTERSAGTEYIEFSCPVSDTKLLHVKVELSGDSYDILQWNVEDIGLWEADDRLNVWLGD